MIYGKVHALFNGVYQYEKCGLRLFKGSTGLCYVNNGCLTNDAGLCNFAFQRMFDGCYNIETSTSATDFSTLLPYTTLTLGCYQSMFIGCTKMQKAPQLPATTLYSQCYKEMFFGCSALNEIKMLATSGLSANSCMTDWVYGVNATGTFTKDGNTTLPSGDSGIPSGWTVQNV